MIGLIAETLNHAKTQTAFDACGLGPQRGQVIAYGSVLITTAQQDTTTLSLVFAPSIRIE